LPETLPFTAAARLFPTPPFFTADTGFFTVGFDVGFLITGFDAGGTGLFFNPDFG
jgi:hypothetical protein